MIVLTPRRRRHLVARFASRRILYLIIDMQRRLARSLARARVLQLFELVSRDVAIVVVASRNRGGDGVGEFIASAASERKMSRCVRGDDDDDGVIWFTA